MSQTREEKNAEMSIQFSEFAEKVAHHKHNTVIPYCGQPVAVGCDGRCDLAVGIDWTTDDGEYDLLEIKRCGETLISLRMNPGTTEGGEAKPASPREFPNKWCVRQCERCKKNE